MCSSGGGPAWRRTSRWQIAKTGGNKRRAELLCAGPGAATRWRLARALPGPSKLPCRRGSRRTRRPQGCWSSYQFDPSPAPRGRSGPRAAFHRGDSGRREVGGGARGRLVESHRQYRVGRLTGTPLLSGEKSPDSPLHFAGIVGLRDQRAILAQRLRQVGGLGDAGRQHDLDVGGPWLREWHPRSEPPGAASWCRAASSGFCSLALRARTVP